MDDKTNQKIKYLEDSYHVMSSLIGLLKLQLRHPEPDLDKMREYCHHYCEKLRILDTERLICLAKQSP